MGLICLQGDPLDDSNSYSCPATLEVVPCWNAWAWATGHRQEKGSKDREAWFREREVLVQDGVGM